MLQQLPQYQTLIPNTNNPVDAITIINKHIEKYHCKEINIDISFMNVIDACYVSTMCSTTHYIKYPDGKINWIISSSLVKEFNKNLELGNSEYIL